MWTLLSYLEADLEVVAQLGAAAQLAVQTLVDEAVEFVGAVAAVVVAIAQQRLVQALPIAAHVGRVVTSPLWNYRNMTSYIDFTSTEKSLPFKNAQKKKKREIGKDNTILVFDMVLNSLLFSVHAYEWQEIGDQCSRGVSSIS